MRDGIAFLPRYPLGGKGKPKHDALQRISAAEAAIPTQVALAWLLPPAILPIPGTSSIAHFDENLAAADLHLSDADFAELRA